MITTNARDLSTRSLRLLAVLDPTETASADAMDDCLWSLNAMIDNWGTSPGSMYTITRSVTSATAAASYTIGLGGTFNVARPEPFQIQRAAYIVPGTSGTTTQEVLIPIITEEMYQNLQMKAQTNPQPTLLYYNPTVSTSAGFGTIYLWPILDQTVSIVLYIQQAVSQFANLTTDILLTPGLEKALRYNLALEMAPIFTVPQGQMPPVIQGARTALADYKRSNQRLSDLPNDAIGITGNRRFGYNIQTDGR